MDVLDKALEKRRLRNYNVNFITIAETKRPEPKTFRVLQMGEIPPRPEWMEDDPSYVESVAQLCRSCISLDVWRDVWTIRPEIGLFVDEGEPAVNHSGRTRHASCRKCGAFWIDIQAVAYSSQGDPDNWWVDDKGNGNAEQDAETMDEIIQVMDSSDRDTHRKGGKDAKTVDWKWWIDRFQAITTHPEYRPRKKRPIDLPLFPYEEIE